MVFFSVFVFVLHAFLLLLIPQSLLIIFCLFFPLISLSVFTTAAPAAVVPSSRRIHFKRSPLFLRLVVVVVVVLLFVVHLISDFSFLLILFDNGRRH